MSKKRESGGTQDLSGDCKPKSEVVPRCFLAESVDEDAAATAGFAACKTEEMRPMSRARRTESKV